MNRRQKVRCLVGVGVVLTMGLTLWRQASLNPPVASREVADDTRADLSAIGSSAHRSSGETASRALAPFPESRRMEIGAVITAIQNESAPTIREELMLAAISAVSIGEIPSVLASLQSESRTNHAEELSKRLIRRWAETDVQAAARWAEGQPEGNSRGAAVNEVATEWANQNFGAAAEWARQLPSEAEQFESLRTIAFEVTQSEPMEAMRLAVEMPPSAQRDELIRHATMEWASQDATSAARWARQITDATLRAQVLTSVALAWADQDPRSAATLVATELPSGRVQSDAAVGVVERWVQVQPEAAAAWVQGFPEGPLRETAMANLRLLWPRPGFTQVR